eukprot:6478123-Prymnesium_polylepis.1
MPIAEDSKKRLVVRYPGTGKLIWASRLPFGYLEAPRLWFDGGSDRAAEAQGQGQRHSLLRVRG